MASGEAFTNDQIGSIERVVNTANTETGLSFSVYVGGAEGDIRDVAERLHARFGSMAARTVLLVVSPGDRLLEIVTGVDSGRRITDRACALAALSMTTSFSGGDLAGGIVTGVRMLAESAGAPLGVTR